MVGLPSFTYASAAATKVKVLSDEMGVAVCVGEDVAVDVLPTGEVEVALGVDVNVSVAMGVSVAVPVAVLVWVIVGVCEGVTGTVAGNVGVMVGATW